MTMPRRCSNCRARSRTRTRKINKALNDDASAIISELYDQIKTVVDKTAEMNGYHIVFAYPDAVTDKEINEPDGEGTEAEAARGPAVLRRQARGPDPRGGSDAEQLVPTGRCPGQTGGREQAVE